ncbi:XdhC family protein [Streptomyces caniscabiei]
MRVSGRAPLPPGTALAVDADGNVIGSVSGGCVEGAVHELYRKAPESGEPLTRTRFGYSSDDALAVGPTRGGELDVLVQRIDPTEPAAPRHRPRTSGEPAPCRGTDRGRRPGTPPRPPPDRLADGRPLFAAWVSSNAIFMAA